jgi:hypothetical protein
MLVPQVLYHLPFMSAWRACIAQGRSQGASRKEEGISTHAALGDVGGEIGGCNGNSTRKGKDGGDGALHCDEIGQDYRRLW